MNTLVGLVFLFKITTWSYISSTANAKCFNFACYIHKRKICFVLSAFNGVMSFVTIKRVLAYSLSFLRLLGQARIVVSRNVSDTYEVYVWIVSASFISCLQLICNIFLSWITITLHAHYALHILLVFVNSSNLCFQLSFHLITWWYPIIAWSMVISPT